jgi:hypothetical protein
MTGSDIRIEGLVCTVDLFPLPIDRHDQVSPSTGSSSSSQPQPTVVVPASSVQRSSHPNVLAYVGEYELRESSTSTAELAGGRFVEAVRLDFGGKRRILFPFPVSSHHQWPMNHEQLLAGLTLGCRIYLSKQRVIFVFVIVYLTSWLSPPEMHRYLS